MSQQTGKEKYVAFLRGINVGGHHKVPMAELRSGLEKWGFGKVVTLLNSGNIVFEAPVDQPANLEAVISTRLEKQFGFSIPTMVRRAATIQQLFAEDPFQDIERTKTTRLYISFLQTDTGADIELPWSSTDGSYTILAKKGSEILSVLDLAVANTPKAMEALERHFGSDITTRNWNTIERIDKKLAV